MTPLETAESYIARGWNPVPMPFRTKAPTEIGWQKRVIDAASVHQHFNARLANIGLIMGPTSGGLTDVDLDCPEAIDVASWLLPRTGAMFGRQSARASHRLYRTTLGQGDRAVYQFKDPAHEGHGADAKKAMLVELRCGGAKGCQTVAPGSVHEEGEVIAWDENGEPATVDDAVLLNRTKLVASAALLARAWPREGVGLRHDGARVVGGFLARAGVPVAIIKLMVEGIVRSVGDPEPKDRVTAAADAATAFSEGGRAYGFPALSEMVGERRAKRIADWLDYDAAREDPATSDPAAEQAAKAAASIITPSPFVYQDPATFPRRQWLLGFDYCRRYLSGLIAPGASGKSSLVIVEALVLVTGRPLLGVKPRETVKVWYYNGEDPREETMRRVLAAMKHYDIPQAEVEGRLFIDSGRDMPISLADAGREGAKVATPVVDRIIAQMQALEIGCLIVDPFVSTHGVGENDNVAINLVARSWGFIAERTNAAVALAHHARKPGGETVTTETSRGASALMDAVRMGRAINKMTKAQADEMGVEEPNRYFRIGGPDSPGKPNLAPPADKTHWFQLTSVDLGNGAPSTGNPFDDHGRESQGPQSDKVAVVTTWEPMKLTDHVESVAQLEEIQRRVGIGKWRESHQSSQWVGVVVADVQGLDITNKGHRARIRRLLGMWYASGALVVYDEKDEHREIKKYVKAGSF